MAAAPVLMVVRALTREPTRFECWRNASFAQESFGRGESTRPSCVRLHKVHAAPADHNQRRDINYNASRQVAMFQYGVKTMKGCKRSNSAAGQRTPECRKQTSETARVCTLRHQTRTSKSRQRSCWRDDSTSWAQKCPRGTRCTQRHWNPQTPQTEA